MKLVVVACNTAAAAALDALQPSAAGAGRRRDRARRALAGAAATRNGRVGVIGTVGTIGSGAYQRAVRRRPTRRLTLTCAACPGFVEFVERGETDSDQVHVLAERLLAPVRDAEVDTLLLGCTHYPYLARTISDVMGRDVVLVSSADETAFEVRAVLDATGLARRGGCGRGHAPVPVVGRRRVVRRARPAPARPRARRRRGRRHGH